MKGKTDQSFLISMVLLGSLFFIFGLVSWVNSILVPYFKLACDLHTDIQSYLVTFAFYIACGTSTETTNSVRKLIPVNKGTLTADSYKKGRMITLNPNNAAANLIATGIIVNSDCSAAYVTDNNHRILRILINTPSY